jgi:hypothetical protein
MMLDSVRSLEIFYENFETALQVLEPLSLTVGLSTFHKNVKHPRGAQHQFQDPNI